MKTLLIAAALFLTAGAAHAQRAQAVITQLPGSDDTDSAVPAFSSSTPMGVTCSSGSIAQIDAAVNANLLTIAGLTYKRASITVQNTSTVPVYVGTGATGWTTSTGGWLLNVNDVWTFNLGKGAHLYCLSTAGTSGTVRVGGWGYKQ